MFCGKVHTASFLITFYALYIIGVFPFFYFNLKLKKWQELKLGRCPYPTILTEYGLRHDSGPVHTISSITFIGQLYVEHTLQTLLMPQKWQTLAI